VTLFFVSIGMLIDVRFIIANWPAVIGMGALIMTAKFLSTLFAVVPFRLDAKTAAFTSLGMVPIGELNYIMAQSGRAINAFPSDLYNLILTSSLITIILTPAAFHISPRVGKLLLRVPLLNKLFPAVSTVPQSAGSMENHAIVAGYGRVGVRMARGMRQVGLDVVVIEQNLHLVRQINEDSTTSEMKRMHAIYGDASSPTVLQAAHPEKARIIIIALPDFGATRAVVHRARQMSSDAIIVARAQRTEDDAVLRDAGATAVVVPEIAGSLLLLEEALILLGVPHDHILTAISPLTAAPPAEANTDQTANAGLHIMEEPMMEDQSELGAAGADNSQRVVNEAQ
jgi:CPA2 family monovalent cation:H+ antiporter-2